MASSTPRVDIFRKEVVPLAHLSAGSVLVALAAPTRLTRLRKSVAWAARATWVGWSTVSAHDLEMERRNRLRLLLVDHSKRVATLEMLDSSLKLRDCFDGKSHYSITNVMHTAHYWAEYHKLDREALRDTRVDPAFSRAATDYFQRRLDAHFSEVAIFKKSLLGGMSLGLLPTLSWAFLRYDGPRNVDVALFGGINLPEEMRNTDEAAAVFDGLENVAWYKGIFSDDSDGDEEYYKNQMEIVPMHQQVFDRRGKQPIFQTLLRAAAPKMILMEEHHQDRYRQKQQHQQQSAGNSFSSNNITSNITSVNSSNCRVYGKNSAGFSRQTGLTTSRKRTKNHDDDNDDNDETFESRNNIPTIRDITTAKIQPTAFVSIVASFASALADAAASAPVKAVTSYISPLLPWYVSMESSEKNSVRLIVKSRSSSRHRSEEDRN
eukprot:jgi/Bigna1/86999/estExt_fgenesh1_pg.C_150261